MRAPCNVCSQGYFVARTRARCRHCGRTTGLLALALSGNHETRVADDPQGWLTAAGNAFIFQVEQLPDHVQTRLSRLSLHFRPAPIAAAEPFEAVAAGYVLEPEYFHSMRRS